MQTLLKIEKVKQQIDNLKTQHSQLEAELEQELITFFKTEKVLQCDLEAFIGATLSTLSVLRANTESERIKHWKTTGKTYLQTYNLKTRAKKSPASSVTNA